MTPCFVRELVNRLVFRSWRRCKPHASADELKDTRMLLTIRCVSPRSRWRIPSAIRSKRPHRRGDLFEKRRRLMQDWETYCSRPSKPADVADLAKARKKRQG